MINLDFRLGELAQKNDQLQGQLATALARAEQAERELETLLRERNDLATRGNLAVKERNAQGARAERAEADLAGATSRAEQAERERDEATDGWVSLTHRMNEREAEHHQQGQDAAKAALEWAALVEQLRGDLEEAFRRLGPAEQAARKETERADLLFVQKNKLATDLAAANREREEAWAAARWAGSLQEAAEQERDAARGERDRLLEALGILERRLEIRGPHNTEDGRSTWICEICRTVREDSRPAKHSAGCPFAARAALEKANG